VKIAKGKLKVSLFKTYLARLCYSLSIAETVLAVLA